jgi:hypothetical protein
MKYKMRVARPTNQLEKISEMYRVGLGLEILGSFKDHDGFDGVILGSQDSGYHLEFTQEQDVIAPRSASPENLLVFYIPDVESWGRHKDQMIKAGFLEVQAHNPYWEKCGSTFEDLEGYRIVLCRNSWKAN